MKDNSIVVNFCLLPFHQLKTEDLSDFEAIFSALK